MPRQPSDLEAAQDDVLKSMIGDADKDAEENEEAPLDNEPDDNDEPDAGDEGDFEQEDDADDTTTEPVVDQPQRQVEATDPNDRFQFKQDREGNLVDKDGKIVFKKGKQREIFTRLKKSYHEERDRVSAISQQFSRTVDAAKLLLNRYNDLKAQKNIAEKLGLTAAEAQQAAEMMAQMKLDPKTGIRKILTTLHLNGTDLKDIGVTGPLDAKTVAEHMVALQKAQQPPAETEEQKAAKEANAFLTRHPGARQYTNVIAQAKMKYPHMSLDEIWFELLRFAQQKRTATPPVAGGKKPNRPIPHNASRGRTVNGKISLKAVDPSQSFRDIGRQLLADIQAAERE